MTVAKEILDDMIEANKDFWPELKQRGLRRPDCERFAAAPEVHRLPLGFIQGEPLRSAPRGASCVYGGKGDMQSSYTASF